MSATPADLIAITREYADKASPTEISALADYIAQCFVVWRSASERAECERKGIMFLSARGLEFIKRHEGLRLRAYKDSGGTVTIGYGHTATARDGQVITYVKANELLKSDLVRFEKVVNETIAGIPVSQHQYDSLVSFAFNIGIGAYRTSTLVKKLRAKDYDGAASEFMRWVHAGGKPNAGLYKRRFEEREMFLGKYEETLSENRSA